MNDSASAMEEVQISLTQPQSTGNILHAGDPLGFDTFAVNSASLWPESMSLNPTHPFLYENPTPSFWWTDDYYALPEMMQVQPTGAGQVDSIQDASATEGTIDPYAKWPHVHQYLKKGPIVQVVPICNFLSDTRSWQEIIIRESGNPAAKTLAPLVVDGIRDTVSARIHVMLSKALEGDIIRKIPHLFPPLEIIKALFEEYQQQFTVLYPMIHPSTFFESTWAADDVYSDVGLLYSAVLVLGAMMVPLQNLRAFAIQLAFLIRNMINETLTRDEQQLHDIWTMSSALLMAVFSAWCGNKRHAELAEAFRGAFSTAFLRRGYFKATATATPDFENYVFGDWARWIHLERKTRVGYIWYILEQEISLFHCVPPTINFSDLRSPIPSADELFFAETEEDWKAMVQAYRHSDNAQIKARLRPPSLTTLYWLFLREDFLEQHLGLTPLHLRLLLCVIQTQVVQYSQHNRFVGLADPYVNDAVFDGSSTAFLRQQELHAMLVKWHLLWQRVTGSEPESTMTMACRLIYHFVCLELLICFNDVQLLAGREGPAGAKPLILQLQRWVKSASAYKALGHVGQIVKLVQRPEYIALRPVWWPVALSRVALIMWAYAFGFKIDTGCTAGQNAVEAHAFRNSALIVINDSAEDGPMGKVVQPGEGTPCLRHAGTLILLAESSDTLKMCMDLLQDGKPYSSPICEDVHRFLVDIREFDFPWAHL